MQLANKYGVSEKTIRRDLEEIRYIRKAFRYKDVTIQMDTTYWGRGFGLMVIRDAVRGKVLWHKYVHWLKDNGFRIYGAVIDEIKGLPLALKPVPVQMC